MCGRTSRLSRRLWLLDADFWSTRQTEVFSDFFISRLSLQILDRAGIWGVNRPGQYYKLSVFFFKLFLSGFSCVLAFVLLEEANAAGVCSFCRTAWRLFSSSHLRVGGGSCQSKAKAMSGPETSQQKSSLQQDCHSFNLIELDWFN